MIGPEKQRIEMQIRTREMHDIAERGVAAHWRYREHLPADGRGEESVAYGWLRDMVDLLERGDSAEEVLRIPASPVPGPGVLLYAQGRR